MLLPMTSLPPKPQKPEEGRGSKAQVGWQACPHRGEGCASSSSALDLTLAEQSWAVFQGLLQTTKPHGDGLMFAAPVSRGSQ